MKPLVCLALCMSLTSLAHAASFDCNTSATRTERTICAQRTLNDQDVKMATLYAVVGHTLAMGGRGALYDQQREWLATRNQCRARVGCLQAAYQQRIGQLEQALARVYSQGPF